MRYFSPIKREHIFLIQKWRNAQTRVLRQRKRLGYKAQIAWFGSLKKDRSQKLFAIFEKANSKKMLIGYCGLTHIDHPNRRAEISFLVDSNRREGSPVYAIDMLSALSFLADYAFFKLKMGKIFTETYEFRKRHIGILERFGFRKEGVLRSHLFLKGAAYNSLLHSILKREYKGRPSRRQYEVEK